MRNKITDADSARIKVLAATGLYTPQEIATYFDDKYNPQQIINHLKTKAPKLREKVKRETSRGGVKLKSILSKIFPHVTIESEYHLGERLRLDFYVGEPYNLGFEFDGIQHSKFIKGLHKDEDDYINGQLRDARKEELCAGRGINLVRVDYNDELTKEFVEGKIEVVGHGTGYIKQGFETSKEKYKENQKKITKVQAARRKTQYQDYKKSDAYAKKKQKQREYSKEQYKRQKEWQKQFKKK